MKTKKKNTSKKKTNQPDKKELYSNKSNKNYSCTVQYTILNPIHLHKCFNLFLWRTQFRLYDRELTHFFARLRGKQPKCDHRIPIFLYDILKVDYGSIKTLNKKNSQKERNRCNKLQKG